MGERRKISLTEARTDGWFEQIAQTTPGFGEVCRLLGETPLAYSIMLGLQIRSVQPDASDPKLTMVEFSNAGSEEVQRARLSAFYDALMEAMLAEEEYLTALPENPTGEQLQAFIGVKYVLMCGLLGVGLDDIEVDGGRPPMVHVTVGEVHEEVSLDDLRRVMQQRLQQQGAQMQPGGGQQIDLGLLPEVSKAAENADWHAVVNMVGGWVGPLTMFTRTLDFQKLPDGQKTELARGILCLAEAYCALGDADGADEAFRLSGQLAQDLPFAAKVMAALGAVYVGSGREAEAIGLLKRAVALGADPAENLPLLAQCFAARERYIPAMVCADEAMAHGVEESEVESVREKALSVLGDAWTRFRDRVPMPRPDAPTIAPAAMAIEGKD